MASEIITYKYKFADDYNPVYTNGVIGGLNSLGEIIIHFFLERPPLPHSQSFEVEDYKVKREIETKIKPEDYKDSWFRYIENGVILNIEGAEKIRDWLDKRIEEAKEFEKSHKNIEKVEF